MKKLGKTILGAERAAIEKKVAEARAVGAAAEREAISCALESPPLRTMIGKYAASHIRARGEPASPAAKCPPSAYRGGSYQGIGPDYENRARAVLEGKASDCDAPKPDANELALKALRLIWTGPFLDKFNRETFDALKVALAALEDARNESATQTEALIYEVENG